MFEKEHFVTEFVICQPLSRLSCISKQGKFHLDQLGTMEVILQKKRQKLNIFSATCKVLFSPFLIPRSAAASTSLQNAFLTRNFKPQPCLIVAIELGKTKGSPSTRKKLRFCPNWPVPPLPPSPQEGWERPKSKEIYLYFEF